MPLDALRALIVDFGGVLTTDLFDCMRGFALREGLDKEAVVRFISTDPAGRQLLASLEQGDITQQQFERALGMHLGVSAERLEARIMADLQPDRLTRVGPD